MGQGQGALLVLLVEPNPGFKSCNLVLCASVSLVLEALSGWVCIEGCGEKQTDHYVGGGMASLC